MNTTQFIDYVKQQLNKLPPTRDVTVHDTHVMLRCPVHKGGEERTASFRVNLAPNYPIGSGRCWACTAKAANWNELAALLRLRPIDLHLLVPEVNNISEADHNALFGTDAGTGLDMSNMLPWASTENWRGISGRLLTKIGGQIYHSAVVQDTQLYLPCMVNQLHVGGISAKIAVSSDYKGPKYFNTAGTWTKTYGLYPFDWVRRTNKTRTVVLGEGPRDALNPLQYGIPCCSILGALNWSAAKIDLLLSMSPKLIILALDNDEAGHKATKVIYDSLKQFVKVRRFNMQSADEDLGNMSKARLRQLKEYLV